MFEQQILRALALELADLGAADAQTRRYRAGWVYDGGFDYHPTAWLGRTPTSTDRKRISRSVAKLEGFGLIVRSTTFGDREARTSKVQITASGRDMMEKLIPDRAADIRAGYEALSSHSGARAF